MQLADLPDSLLVRILQEIPLKPRVGVCARVCRAWAAAAAACTADLEHEIVGTSQCNRLQRWFTQHAQQIEVVHITASFKDGKRPVFELPTARLTNLIHMCVDGVRLQLQTDQTAGSTRSSSGRGKRKAAGSTKALPPPAAAAAAAGGTTNSSSSTAATAAVLPKMQHLGIKACQMTVPELLKLSLLTTLDSLHLVSLDFETSVNPTTSFEQRQQQNKNQPDPTKPMQTILPQLTRFTDLAAGGFSVHQQLDAAAITNLQHLQRLALDSSCCPEGLVPVLPAALTALELTGIDIVAPDHLQALSRLSSLQELYLTSVWLDPKVGVVCAVLCCAVVWCGLVSCGVRECA
jgi:hypothetical protein